jgi:hypothetical protein
MQLIHKYKQMLLLCIIIVQSNFVPRALWQRARLEGVFNLHSRFILWLLH